MCKSEIWVRLLCSRECVCLMLAFFLYIGQERRYTITSCMSLVSLIPFTDTTTIFTLPVSLGKQRQVLKYYVYIHV